VPDNVPATTKPKAPMFHTPQEYEQHIAKIEKEYALAIEKVTRIASQQVQQKAPPPPPPAEGTDGAPPPVTDRFFGAWQQMHQLMEKAGEQGFDQRIIDILSEGFDERIIDIKPNGTVFVSHIHYRDRLDRAFGPGGWALIQLGMPKLENKRVLWFGFLKANGQFIESAIGGTPYVTSRDGYFEMNYDDCIEGAKSDCLTRCCKALPMFRQLWDKSYADYWKATYAEEGYNTRTQKKEWKKKGEAMRNWTTRPERSSESEFKKPASLDKENLQHLNAIAKEGTLRAMPDPDWPEEHEYPEEGHK